MLTKQKITLDTSEFFALMVLGSEATVKILPYAGTGTSVTASGKARGKAGEVIMQHGDVIGFKVDKGKLDISVKMEGFGFGMFSLCSFGMILTNTQCASYSKYTDQRASLVWAP